MTGRDDTTLEPLLSFAARYVSHPRYTKLLVVVAHKLIDLFGVIKKLFLKLHKQVKAEVGFQRQIMQVMGSLDAIVTSTMIPSISSSGSAYDDNDNNTMISEHNDDIELEAANDYEHLVTNGHASKVSMPMLNG